MNSTVAYVILGVTAGFFVLLGVLALTVLRRIRYPKGERFTRDVDLYGSVMVLLCPGVTLAEDNRVRLLDACARALHAVGEAWRQHDTVGRWEPYKELHDFCFIFRTDADYEAAWKGDFKVWGPATAAVRGQLVRGIGTGPFCALIRASLIDHVITTGQPAIHEAIHGLEKWDSYHAAAGVWEKSGNSDCVESRACAIFRRDSRG